MDHRSKLTGFYLFFGFHTLMYLSCDHKHTLNRTALSLELEWIVNTQHIVYVGRGCDVSTVHGHLLAIRHCKGT
ncbi:hypothetical protein Mapa_002790 [Marchantia paleacea]|nr:hypothetical protein Mapa_002790 [Marchantia paleacea]